MRRLLGIALCLAAAWLLYWSAVELFVAWYSGVEEPPEPLTIVAFGVQAAVDVAAFAAGWRLARGRVVRDAVGSR